MSAATRSLAHASRLQAGERRRFALSTALAFGATIAATGLLATSGYLISRAAQRPEILELTAVITAVRAFAVTRAGLRYAERLASHDLALRVLARLRASFYAVLAPLGAGALGQHRRGELLSRFVADVDALQDLYLRALAPPIVALLMIASAALAAWLMLPGAALVIAGGLVAAGVLGPLLAGLLSAQAGRRQAPARAALTAELVEALDGGVELAVAGRGPDRVARLRGLSDRLTSISRRDALAAAVATVIGSALAGLTIVAVLLVGIPAVHGHVLAGVLLAAVVFIAFGAFDALTPLPAAARSLRGCAEAAMRLDELAALPPAVSDPVAPRPLPVADAAELVLGGVRFRYPDSPEWQLDGVDLRLAPGCRVALTGPSGAGKSTLASLLVRFADPTEGSITLGGVDLRELALDDVRRTVVLSAQDAHVFTTTIRENLLLARRSASEPELWEALRTVQLADWVASLPDGLDTLIGEDGDLVSGGQRQRIVLARALIADAAFLVLDEPTAHLDPDTAESLLHAVDHAAGARGVLVISHRPEGLEQFDVRRLERGRLQTASHVRT